MSSDIIFAMIITISSTSQNSYWAGRILTAVWADFTRLRGNAWLLLFVDDEPTRDCRLFMLGDSTCKIGIAVGGGAAATTIGAVGFGCSAGSTPIDSAGTGSLLTFMIGLHCVPASTYCTACGGLCMGGNACCVDLEARREDGEEGAECGAGA
jgi:hypothetical protein